MTDPDAKPVSTDLVLERPVVRARASAADERSTLVLRPPQFFELALPIIGADEHDETEEGHRAVYPPSGSVLKLTSANGYEREYRISQGVCTGDGFCSFRFYDIDKSQADDPFTATLVWNDGREVIFENKRIARYIAAARNNEEYEPIFGPGARVNEDEVGSPAGATGSDAAVGTTDGGPGLLEDNK